MSTQTEHTDQLRHTPGSTADATVRRPARRTIVLSVLAGAVAALMLALGVFAGGTESTITDALLGFGFAGRGSPARSPRTPGSAPTTAPDRAGATKP